MFWYSLVGRGQCNGYDFMEIRLVRDGSRDIASFRRLSRNDLRGWGDPLEDLHRRSLPDPAQWYVRTFSALEIVHRLHVKRHYFLAIRLRRPRNRPERIQMVRPECGTESRTWKCSLATCPDCSTVNKGVQRSLPSRLSDPIRLYGLTRQGLREDLRQSRFPRMDFRQLQRFREFCDRFVCIHWGERLLKKK